MGVWAALGAGGVYLSLLNNFLRFQQYPLLRLEVLYAALGGVVLAVFFGLVYQAVGYGGKLVGRIIRAALVAGLVVYAVGLVMESHEKLVVLAAFVVAMVARDNVLRPIAIMSCVAFLAGSLGIGQQRQAQFTQTGARNAGPITKSAIVHVILDDHIGLEGFPPRDPDAGKMKDLLRTFYTSHGFKVFGGAYSRYFWTGRSIPRILNFGNADDVKSNAYFRRLKQAGYSINVIQSDYIDYCSALADRCTTYHAQSFRPIAESPLDEGQKAGLIARAMIPKSAVDAMFEVGLWLERAGYGGPSPMRLKALSPVALNGLAALKQLQHEVADLRPGELYFAHILLPHDPFVLRADCSVERIERWVEGGPGSPLAQRYHAYDQQALCALQAMSGVLRAIERSPGGDNAILIVHGDHGSRIGEVAPMAENTGKFGANTLVAGFSTLFAVRAPGISPGYDDRHYPVAALLHELATSNWRKVGSHPVDRPSVLIIDKMMVARRRQELPAW